MTTPPFATPLSDDEYEALGALLATAGARVPDVSTLEGFLTALVVAPGLTPPSAWLPRVWDDAAGAADTERALGLILRHYNHLAQWLMEDAASFEPIFHCGPEWGIAAWCQGFLAAMELDAGGWAPLLATQADWFAPMQQLAASEQRQPAMTDEETQRWMDAVAPAVIAINAVRLQQQGTSGTGAARPVQRATPKVGRNAPCPCGSGKKYKKCCGADA
ncbi:MAG: UPF0149 family protein [Pseudomonadota bacterium]